MPITGSQKAAGRFRHAASACHLRAGTSSDDSDIIVNEGGGVILDRNNPTNAFQKLKELISMGREHNLEEIQRLAQKHRSLHVVEAIYRQEFTESSQLTNV